MASPNTSYKAMLPGRLEPRFSPAGIALALAVQVALLTMLGNASEHHAPTDEQAIVISLLAPETPRPAVEQPKKNTPIPKPVVKPVVKKVTPQKPPQEQVPTLAVPSNTLQDIATVAETRPSQEPSPAAVAQQPAAQVVASEEPTAIEPPQFNADYLDNPSPAYPTLSRRQGQEGRVMLRVQVDNNGLPAKVLIHKSSGHTPLDESAADTVRRWKFVPANQGGQPVAAWVIVPIQFSLRG